MSNTNNKCCEGKKNIYHDRIFKNWARYKWGSIICVVLCFVISLVFICLFINNIYFDGPFKKSWFNS